MAESALNESRSVVIDNTNLDRESRQRSSGINQFFSLPLDHLDISKLRRNSMYLVDVFS